MIRATPRWHLKGTPYAVQLEALRRSAGREGYAFFMEQGLGKTAVALNEYLDLLVRGEILQMAVICPNFVKGNWPDEIATWARGISGVVVWPDVPDRDTTIFLMNFEALLGRGYEVMEEFIRRAPTYLVADESQKIKTHNAQTTKRAILLSVYASVTRVMTGTPVTLNVLDYWPQLRFIKELRGSNPYSFRNTYAVMGGYMGKKIVGVKEEQKLNAILDKCAFRARKAEWTDLPEKIYTTRSFDMTPAQLKLYKQMKQDFYIELTQDREVAAPMVVTQMMKLQQISRGFVIDERGKAQQLVEPKKNPALLTLLEILEATAGKVIIFCYFRHSAEVILAATKDLHPAMIRGGMATDEVKAQRDAFNNDPACRVMVAQVAAGSIGLTLLGGQGDDRCSTTVFYENTYALGDRSQAEDRNHRHGQDRAVVYIDLSGSPQDKAVIGALQKKKSLVDVIVESIKSNPR